MENEHKLYYHDHGDGVVHCHELEPEHTSDGHVHPHVHPHSHTQTKAVVNRLARAIGHLESVKRMVEEGRDCTEVLVQLDRALHHRGRGRRLLPAGAQRRHRQIHLNRQNARPYPAGGFLLFFLKIP